MQRELAPQPMQGLTTAKCQAVDGRPYYINLLTCQIQTHIDKYADVGGGIICEDMVSVDVQGSNIYENGTMSLIRSILGNWEDLHLPIDYTPNEIHENSIHSL